MRLIAALRSRGRDERGFTMLTVITVIFCVTLLSVAALSAAQNDLKPGAHDKSRKVAYAAAEAGVQNYLYHLSKDLDYWAKCTTGAQPHAVNDPWNGSSPAADPRAWMSIPGSTARYTIELLPANGAAACSTADPAGTMIDGDSGSFKVRATGEERPGGVKRSIIATFKRQSLLDFLYFTDKETRAPELYAALIPSRTSRENGNPTRDLVGWARESCDRYWGAAGKRNEPRFDGEYLKADGVTWQPVSLANCVEQSIRAGDVMAGPVHTNDELSFQCADPVTLGDTIDDAVETSSLGQPADAAADPKGGFVIPCPRAEPIVNYSTTTSPVQAGTSKPRSAPLTLPLSNSALLADTADAYRFKGTTKITMNGTSMRVTGTLADGTVLRDDLMEIPADGVVYVANDGSCSPGYTPVDSAGAPATCGNLELQGDYARNVTFTAENDILVTDDVRRTPSGSPFLLGLIAANYVRVNHPVSGCEPASPVTCNRNKPCANAPGTKQDITVQGAILSLTRSFIADNWFCGETLDRLTVYGAIAQKFRGSVYTDGHGYLYRDYTYDTRLRYRSPPHFLDPVNAQWRLKTFSEQVPAR